MHGRYRADIEDETPDEARLKLRDDAMRPGHLVRVRARVRIRVRSPVLHPVDARVVLGDPGWGWGQG